MTTYNTVHQKIKDAQKKNKDVAEKVKSDPAIVGLNKDTDHLKLFVYLLATVLLGALLAGWQMYVHLDEKIDKKLDYINLRIDKIVEQSGKDLTELAKPLNDKIDKKLDYLNLRIDAVVEKNPKDLPVTTKPMK